jgi:phosphatidylinositol alpha-mannosyltransferase
MLLDDAGRRAELSAAALAAVAQYDWSVVAHDVLRVYETVMLGRTGVAVATDGGDIP